MDGIRLKEKKENLILKIWISFLIAVRNMEYKLWMQRENSIHLMQHMVGLARIILHMKNIGNVI